MTIDRKRYKGAYAIKSKGAVYWYYNANGKNGGGAGVRIDAPFGTPDFDRLYKLARDGALASTRTVRHKAGAEETAIKTDSLRWLVHQHYQSAKYRTLKTATADMRNRALESVCAVINTRTGLPFGVHAFATIGQKHVSQIVGDAATPSVGNARLEHLTVFFNWAIREGHATVNPCNQVSRRPKLNPNGFHTWTIRECEKFEAAHAVGTLARLAYELLRYLGVRRSDVIRLGLPMLENGMLHFFEAKGFGSKVEDERYRPKQKEHWAPVPAGLWEVIHATPGASDGETFLKSPRLGRAFSDRGFIEAWYGWIAAAKLPHVSRGDAFSCMPHGIRKRSATDMANGGANNALLKAVFGWTNDKMPNHYTQAADAIRLKAHAMGLLSRERGQAPAADNVVPLKRGKRSAA